MAGRAGKLTASLSRPLLASPGRCRHIPLASRRCPCRWQGTAGSPACHEAGLWRVQRPERLLRPSQAAAMQAAKHCGAAAFRTCLADARGKLHEAHSFPSPASPAGPLHPCLHSRPGGAGLRAEQREAVQLLSHLRARHGLAPLKWTPDSDLQAAAMVRAREITRMFSHARPDGQSFESAMGEAGIAYRRFGENIASGTRMDAAGATRGWEHSPRHRGNMLSRDFKEVGIALWREGRKAYWVQLFLTRR